MLRNGLTLIFTAFLTAACSSAGTTVGTGPGAPDKPASPGAATIGEVKVSRARVFIWNGRPQALLEGEIGDGCNSLQPITQKRSGNTIDVAVTYRRQGEICTMIMQLLNHWVPLDGSFPPGEYELRVSGQRVPFTIAGTGANLRVEPDPGPLPSGVNQP